MIPSRGGNPEDQEDPEGRLYVAKTLRSTALVTAFVVLMLASYRQSWAIAPLLIGVALAASLLLGWDVMIRMMFSPAAVLTAKKNHRDRRWALLAFALVKYPLVALLLWTMVRFWASDQRRLAAFIAGFILLQIVIALRAVGRLLTERSDNKE